MKSKIKNFLYKKKQKIYRFPKHYLKNIFWEENEDNMYYGHYDIFKVYTKSFLPFKINGEVQHGWAGKNSGIPIIHEKLSKGPTHKRYYVFNETNKKKCNDIGYKNVIAIGAPFIYLNDIYKPNIEYHPNSLILFPFHSTEWEPFTDPVKYYKEYLDELKEVITSFERVTVSLYYLEYDNIKIRKIFESKGINVITMGSRNYNPKFLFNFIDIVRKHEYVCSDTFSSAIFYSLFLKKKVFLFIGGMKNSNHYGNDFISRNLTYSKKYPGLLWNDFNHESHFYISHNELGLKHKKSPKELSLLFGWNLKETFKKTAKLLIN